MYRFEAIIMIRIPTRLNSIVLSFVVLVFVTSMYLYMDIHRIMGVKRKWSFEQVRNDKRFMLKDTSFVRPIKTRTMYPVATNSSYIINNPKLCRQAKKVSCLIMVHTAPAHRRIREIMRNSWLNTTHYFPNAIIVIFLVGTVNKPIIQQALYNESKEYGDIIQGDFIDSYRNLSNKGIMGFRWISENCRNAEIVLKIDDDAFINLFKLFEDLDHLKRRKKYIFCNRSPGNTMPIERDVRSKWSVHEDQFRGFKLFPHMYCSGVALFLSIDLIPALFQAALSTPFFWIDDMFLFGVLPSKIPGVVYGSFTKNFSYYFKEGFECYRDKGSDCHFLFVDATFYQVTKLWEQVLKGRRKTQLL